MPCQPLNKIKMDTDIDIEYPDFTNPDDLSSVILILEGNKLYAHREVLAAWSPVFRSMFLLDFKEKSQEEIELPGKKLDDFVELLHCMYPPIKPIHDSNVYQILPLAEEYQVLEVKRRCEEFFCKNSTKNMELLITAQAYGLKTLLAECINHVKKMTYLELQKDPYYNQIYPENLIEILRIKVEELEDVVEGNKRRASERDARLYGCINDLASGYGNFCAECKSRKVSENCTNCLKMFRDRVKSKCEEAKAIRRESS